MSAAITGWGWYSPERVLTNQDLEKLVHTSDEWIRSRTGISERRQAGPGETTSSMCLLASQKALAEAGLSARELDLIICTTTTPDYLLPATACLIQHRLGADKAGAFDLNTACSGFLYAVSVASQFIHAGAAKRILITAGEVLSRFTNWEDRSTCVLFGDGAAAVILEATTQHAGVLSTVLGSRGDVEGLLTIEGGGCARPATAQTVADKDHLVRMRGNEVFKMAVRNMVQACHEALHRAGLTLADVRAVIPHQANHRILLATEEALGLAPGHMFVNVERHGNTGASSIGIALGEYLESQPAEVGDNFLFVAFGGGLTWAAAVIRWADVAAIRRERGEAVAEPESLPLPRCAAESVRR
jgi:3-oxoacyl-[acyl-carrier-protein] synthase-3